MLPLVILGVLVLVLAYNLWRGKPGRTRLGVALFMSPSILVIALLLSAFIYLGTR